MLLLLLSTLAVGAYVLTRPGPQPPADGGKADAQPAPVPPAPPPALPAPPAPRGALAFDGTSYVELPLLPYTAGEPLCVEAWATPGMHPLDRSPRESQDVWASGFWGVTWHALGSWSFVRPHTNQVFSLRPPVLGARTHLAGVWDGKTITLFVDGRFQQRSSASPKPALALVDERSPRFHRIGSANDTPKGLRNSYVGTIDQLRISRAARYADDFRPPERFDPDPDTISLYRFDEGQGTTLNDASGNGHRGRIRGAKWVAAGVRPVGPVVPPR